MGRPKDQREQQRTRKWNVHTHLHADDSAVFPLDEDMLSGLQFGGKRNYGYGEVRLKATQLVDLDDLDDSRLKGTEMHFIELVTPFVVKSEYSDANNQGVPWWWAESRTDLRVREEKLLEQREAFRLRRSITAR